MKKITVFGSFMVDNVASMDRYPEAGETIVGKSLQIFLGGKGANQCIALARQNADVRMIGMVGNDANGQKFIDLFKKENIDVSNVFVTDKNCTGTAQIQINKNGQNRICVIPCANHESLDEQFEKVKPVLKDSDYVICQLEMDIETTFKVIEYCKQNNVKVILNPAPAIKLPDYILKNLDYLMPNETELALISNLDTSDINQIKIAAKALFDKGVKHVVTTLGSKGAFIFDENGARIVSSYHVDAIDTVAAGDSFIGAFAYSLSEGCSIEDAVKYGNAMGALTVQVKGAIPSLHHKEEVEQFIKENKPLETIKL